MALRPLTVAAVQAESVPGEVARNADRAAQLVARAADRGAAVTVLPELFLPAYHPPTLTADPDGTDLFADAAGHIRDPRLETLCEITLSRRVVAVVGAAVRWADGRRTCSAVVVDREGRARAGYAKQHLCGPVETELFAPGDHGATLVVDGWRFGLGICYDGCFPEHGRAAADDGAHGYLCPSGYVDGSQHRRDLYYPARALDNTMYVVFANSVGGVSPWHFNGGAAIYDPQGRPLARAADDGEELVTTALDPTELARVRASHTMLADRLPGPGGPRRTVVG